MITIFLDIDGVLSTLEESLTDTKKFWEKNPWAKKEVITHPFNIECVNAFNSILKAFNCEIILTSDWKKRRNIAQLNDIFERFGVIQSPVGVTKNLRFDSMNFEMCRSTEIVHFIAENSVDKFIIIDDINLEKLLPPRIVDRFFKTDFSIGLKDKILVEKIINKLKEIE